MMGTSRVNAVIPDSRRRISINAKGIIWVSAASAAVYPWFLDAFHWAVTSGSAGDLTPNPPLSAGATLIAALMLAAAFSVPLLSLILAGWSSATGQKIVARRFALLTIVAPTAYVFFGVVSYMLGSKIADNWIWTPAWVLLGFLASRVKEVSSQERKPISARLRVAHGISGSIAAVYVLFHIGNHMAGLLGPEAHGSVMEIGRTVYRSAFGEPILVAVMLFQIVSGLQLAWKWSETSGDAYRIFQIASGVFMSVFILGHMNSVFIFARTFLGIPTDWAFAAGLPTGLLHDPWNIRLLPHYALGVFFVLTHLACGLRVVLLGHGVSQTLANRLWWMGAVCSALVSLAIMCGMVGFRVA